MPFTKMLSIFTLLFPEPPSPLSGRRTPAFVAQPGRELGHGTGRASPLHSTQDRPGWALRISWAWHSRPLGILVSGKGHLLPLALNVGASVGDGDMGAGVGVEVVKRQVTEKLDPRKVFLPQECHKCHGRGRYKCSGCHGACKVSLV